MSHNTYEFDISRATAAADLLFMATAIQEDESLSPEEKEELEEAIKARFGQLNLQAVQANGPVRGRWDPK